MNFKITFQESEYLYAINFSTRSVGFDLLLDYEINKLRIPAIYINEKLLGLKCNVVIFLNEDEAKLLNERYLLFSRNNHEVINIDQGMLNDYVHIEMNNFFEFKYKVDNDKIRAEISKIISNIKS